MAVLWGRDLTLLYNDAYIKLLGPTKHPRVLAQSGRVAWAEVWDQIEPMIAQVVETKTATWSEDIAMFFARDLPTEEVFVTFSLSPIFGDSDTVDGIFCACSESTEKVIGARRLETLRTLSAASSAKAVPDACHAIVDIFNENPLDVPCAVLYLQEGSETRAAAWVRMDAGDGGFTNVITDDRFSGLRGVTEIPMQLSPQHWPEPITHGVAIPIHGAKDELVGTLVCGSSPRRPFDAAYRTFFELVGRHVAAALTSARASDHERQRAVSLAQLDRAKTAFFTNISHEFRTPLTLILGPLEELLSRIEDPATQEQLSLIQRNSIRLQKLVNALLDFSRIEAGREEMAYEPTHLATMTADIASAFRATIEHAGLELVIACEPIDEWVYVDPGAWEMIVLNLVSNAFKYTFEGRITVAMRRVGDRVRLEVRDTGVGIGPDELARVFERFHRIEGQQARSYEGSGIGLALVKELVRLHGGTIDVTSTPGAGTTFCVTLPLGHAHLPANQTKHLSTRHTASPASDAFISEAVMWQREDSIERASQGDVAKPRLLVADDNADMRAYMKRLLEPDFIVEAVGDGTRALEIAATNAPDLVLADVMMPGRDGLSLLRALRADAATQHLPVILVSARSGEEARIDGMQGGANDYIVKPFSAPELRRRVRSQLDLALARSHIGTARPSSLRAKDDFLSLFGHELRNPLSTVFTTLQVLMRQSPSIEVMVMERAVRHLTRLVDDLLDLSRLQRGKIVLSRARVELGDVVTQALDRVGAELEDRKISVLDTVPKAGMQLECDPERVAQVLANVLRNAAKFSEPGSKVAVEAVRADKRVRIIVRDEGAGIAADRLPHVFDALQDRGNGTGLGIGLAIARNLTEMHGGTITLHSAGVGRGTECQIELPMTGDQIALPTPAAVESRKKKRVLLVEDNHDTAVALQRALETLGYEVALAHNGPVALTVARAFQPDVALLDIGLPVMDGWELSRRLRELRVPSRELHIVAVTARDQDADKQRSRDAGFAEHLVKPIDLNRLERVVESLPDPSLQH